MIARNPASLRRSPPSNRRALHLGIAAALATGALTFVPAAHARVVSVTLSAPTVAFGGHVFPGVGKYVKITGVAYAEVDPSDRRNSVITDINLSQTQPAAGQPGKTSNGKVAYLLNFYILKPMDLSAVDPTLNGYGKAMYEPPNRGNKQWAALGRVTGGAANDPATITDPTVLANSFLMPRGYTLIWSGWEPLVPQAQLGTSLTAAVAIPLAKQPNGDPITGPAYEYNAGSGTASPITLTYPAANLDQSTATLLHRVHWDDPQVAVPASGWTYNASGTGITLLPAGTVFTANDVYEFKYTAKDPTVAGLGFAAVRDLVSWLRYSTTDDVGIANPLANYLQQIYTIISSQPGRMLNDFRHLGFNEDDSGTTGRKVFDGHTQWISAAAASG